MSIIFTIGHASFPHDVFFSALTPHNIQGVIDVRSYPSSKRNPQFNRDAISQACADRGLDYAWISTLGGKMGGGIEQMLATPQGEAAIQQLVAQYCQEGQLYVMMCAESDYQRCHRSVIASEVVRRGVKVVHLDAGKPGWTQLHVGHTFVRDSY